MAKFEISNVVHKPDIRGTISLIGRAMITVGLILLLFVAYQLWGTNIFEQRSQKNLRNDFAQKLENVKKAGVGIDDPTVTNPDGTPVTTAPGDSTTTTTPLLETPQTGEPIAFIEIDKIGLDHVVVSGTDRKSLQKGPGHYPATPLPGQFGNSSIAGHRTTYGSPFARLDELEVGDKIILRTVRGPFTYEVSERPFVVSPSDVSVVAPTPDPSDPTGQTLLPTLTLTTCHPKYSAAQRLIVKAKLVDGQATEATQLYNENGELPTTIDLGDEDVLSDDAGTSNILVAMVTASLYPPLLWWLLLLVTVGGIWWYCYRRYNKWKAWFIGVIPFGIVLLVYFINLEQILPTGI
jgi:sortase A